VRDVFVAGRQVVRDGRSTTLDVAALWDEAQQRQASLLRRTGITVPHRWPQIDAS
jgi:5-methylthioadenosine/S-adenosylhomocysteine deaminase